METLDYCPPPRRMMRAGCVCRTCGKQLWSDDHVLLSGPDPAGGGFDACYGPFCARHGQEEFYRMEHERLTKALQKLEEDNAAAKKRFAAEGSAT